MNRIAVAVKIYIDLYSDVLGSNLDAIATPDVLRCFPKSLQANAGVML
jgi:hypothetical protein